jgi:hypothetical protein
MKRAVFGLLALTLVTGWASPGWAAGVTLTIRGGRVSLDAQDVTIRQILTEWARVGKTRIVNLERVNSGPVTLKFDAVPEEEALDIILRALPGYMAAPRATLVADASIYDRIVIMPSTTAVAALPPQRGQSPVFQSQTPMFQDPSSNVTQLRPASSLNPGVLPEPDDQRDPRDPNDPAIAAAAAAGLTAVPAPMPGGFGPIGPLQPPVRGAGAAPPAAGSPSNPWNAPVGASRPGPAPTPPPPSTNLPPGRGVGARPQQADQ